MPEVLIVLLFSKVDSFPLVIGRTKNRHRADLIAAAYQRHYPTRKIGIAKVIDWGGFMKRDHGAANG